MQVEKSDGRYMEVNGDDHKNSKAIKDQVSCHVLVVAFCLSDFVLAIAIVFTKISHV